MLDEALQQLKNAHGGIWGEHPRFPVAEWRHEVANDETRQGYWEWVEICLEDDPDPDPRGSAMTRPCFLLSGQFPPPVPGITLATVLTVSTRHMPDITEDLSAWSFGKDDQIGCEWFYAYEEDPSCNGNEIPSWLLQICMTARHKYDANWVLLDPYGDVLDDFPVFDH